MEIECRHLLIIHGIGSNDDGSLEGKLKKIKKEEETVQTTKFAFSFI